MILIALLGLIIFASELAALFADDDLSDGGE